MVPSIVRIHGLLKGKVKVKVKGHVIRALLWCHEMFAIQYGLTFCLYMRSLYETPLYSPSSISIRQLSKYWNELLRHWRSGIVIALYYHCTVRLWAITTGVDSVVLWNVYSISDLFATLVHGSQSVSNIIAFTVQQNVSIFYFLKHTYVAYTYFI